MTAIDMLKRDHKKVLGLLHQFETAGQRAGQRKQRIAKETFEVLELHTKLEEEIFYPVVRSLDQRGGDLVNQASEEHSIVKLLAFELRPKAPNADGYAAKFKVLTDNVRHHIHEEEAEILPHAAAKLDAAALDALRHRLVARRRELSSALPSLLSDTLKQAKKLVAKALDVLTASPPAGRAKASRSRRSPRRAVAHRKRAQTTPRSPHTKAAKAGSRSVHAIAKLKRARWVARVASARQYTKAH